MIDVFEPTNFEARALITFGASVGIRATVLLLICWVAHATLGRRSALARSSLWNAGVLGLLCLPLIGLALPRIKISLPPGIQAASQINPVQQTQPEIVDQANVGGLSPQAARDLPDVTPISGQTSQTSTSLSARSPEAAEPGANRTAASATREELSASAGTRVRLGWEWLIISVYGAVAGLMFLRLIGSLVAVGRLRSGCVAVESAIWLEARDRWGAHLGLSRRVELLMSDRVSVPVMVGHLRPAVILPRSLTGRAGQQSDPELIDAILLHELGHVRRGDFLWNVLRSLAQILYWPHPLVWFMSHAIRAVREQACDDLCVHGLGGAPMYRAALVQVASGLVRRPASALGLSMANASDLSRRLEWIDTSPGSSRCLPRWPLRFVLGLFVVSVSVIAGAAELSRTAVAAQIANPAAAAKEEAAFPSDLKEVISSLRAEEEKYKNIEYVLQMTTRQVDPKALEVPGEVTSQISRNVVLEGDRIFLRDEVSGRHFKTDRRTELVSAYDGEQTRTVIPDQSVSVNIGRFEHPDVYPAHCIPLIHYSLNFPLSVYLSGGDAIHAHPKYPHFARETGTGYEFTKVEARVEGEEMVDGLRCVKLRVNRWFYSKDSPLLQYLWLAPKRNYICVKELASWPKSMYGDLLMHEMHVDEMRESAPGIWLPAKVTVVNYDPAALRQKKQVVQSRTTTVVESVALNPHHNVAFFRDIKIPADLPVFAIKDGTLVGSSLPEPIADAATETAKLAEIVAKVREEEMRYSKLEVRARDNYRHVGTRLRTEGIITDSTHELRSNVQGKLEYFTGKLQFNTAGGKHSEQLEMKAFDGQWTRGLSEISRDDRPKQIGASLQKGGGEKAEGRNDGLPVLRPHTFLLRDDWLYGPLSDLLVSPWHDKRNKYRLRFRYCGEENLDGHPCVKLRGEVSVGADGQPPSSFMALWLAIDRNFIPLKLEHYGGNFGLQPIPGGIYRCSDLREIAPGLWYPFRSSLFAFDNWVKNAQGIAQLNWRRDFDVQSVLLAPKVDEALFRDVVVPAKTKVGVIDEDQNYLGQFEQEREGIAEITPVRFMALQSEAKVRDEEQKARQQAIDALIGKPAPEFPTGGTWLNSTPLTWKSLRGKVVVLDFWAEWCGPCRNDFPQLAMLHDAREAIGLTVIGIHPPGSEPEAMKKVIDEFHLGYPTCVDIPSREGLRAWGDTFGQFAVHAIPHAVVVDGKGLIVASGPLQQVLGKAMELSKQR